MDDSQLETLEFVVTVESAEDDGSGTMGGLFRRSGEVEVRQIPLERLRESLLRASTSLSELFEAVARQTGGLQLSEAQVKFEVSASGGVRLIGSTEVKGTGAITLVFRK